MRMIKCIQVSWYDLDSIFLTIYIKKNAWCMIDTSTLFNNGAIIEAQCSTVRFLTQCFFVYVVSLE